MTSKQKNLGPLTIGLDIGIASVGWAVLGETRIVDLGVRCFDKAETADKGESLNLARRTARLMRRRLRRRAWRLTKLARLLKREGLITDVNMLKQQPAKGFKSPNLWQLRVEALDRKLEAEEWARVIYHLTKHRGFHWISRAEAKAADKDNEGGKVKKGLAGTKTRMREKSYRTAAEMVVHEFPDAQRNKQGDYTKALSRELLADELKVLFQHQRELGNPHTSTELETAILGNGNKKSGLFWAQKPALSGQDLLKMLGHCTFEKAEYRAPKASFTAERHVWLTRLNNLRIVVDGKLRTLTEAERQIALPLPYQQISDSNAKKESYKGFSYKQLRKALTKGGLTDEFRFAGLSYPSERQQKEDKAKDPEDEKLIKLPAWQELNSTLKEAGQEAEWQQLSVAALDGKPQLLDQIAWVLSVYKEDREIETELCKLELPNNTELVKALSLIKFDKFSNLSLKALYAILPHMEAGLRYDEACEKAGYHHSLPDQHNAQAKFDYLPPFYTGRDKDGRLKFNEDMDIPRNPVVLRALNQARKVVNALIRKYGSPYEVHIEMARDLSRNFDERRDIKKEQDAYRERNEKDRAAFNSEYNATGKLKGRDFEKYQLYREQQGKCPYCGNPLDIARLFEMKYVEIDHALPYSRSFDDSKNNRVAVHARCNQDKGNKTPYEYLDGANDSPRWQNFVALVNSTKTYRQAKRNRLLKKDFGEKESKDFMDRNLNDTRYICRFFKNYVEQYLKLHDESDKKRCVVLSGQMTSFLRARWGLVKVRGDSDRHHALDAAVVAAASHGMVKRLSDYSRRKELEKAAKDIVDTETGEIINRFPNPWPHFRNELEARLKIDDPALLREEMEQFGSYPQEALETLRPLFVSRAPQRRNGGAMHQETIRSSKLIDQGISYVKVPLQKLKLSDLEKIVGATYSHNNALIALLRKRLEDHGGDGKKAFAEPVYKPSAAGKAPIVRAVKLTTTQKGGMRLREGIADLGNMLHVSIYRHKDKYLVEPAYAANKETQVKATSIPQGATFLFSLTKNDYVKINLGNSEHEGYFVMYESDGRLTLRAHDQPKPDKEYFRKGIGSATRIEKFHVDALGHLYLAQTEKSGDLA